MAFKARAYAKINLFLDIIGKRADGYHDIDTVMQSVSVYDEISLSLTDCGITVFCDKEDLAGENNIVVKACKAFFEYLGMNTGVEIEIKKNIPVAAGLGGGSADAAATLMLLNKALNTNYTNDILMPIATKLGADVPFFLMGGTARAEGIGEVLTDLKSPKMYYVLLKEYEKQSTGQMYSMLDSMTYQKQAVIEDLISAMKADDKDKILSNLFNAFEYCWDMNVLKAPFSSYNSSAIFLSGSGPTVCAIFKTKHEAENCARELASKGYNVLFAESQDFGVQIV